MLSIRWILPAAALVMASPALSQVPGQGGAVNWGGSQATDYSPQALQAFNDFVAQWGAAWRAGDARRVSGFYSVGAAVSLKEDEMVRGREEFQGGGGPLPEVDRLRPVQRP